MSGWIPLSTYKIYVHNKFGAIDIHQNANNLFENVYHTLKFECNENTVDNKIQHILMISYWVYLLSASKCSLTKYVSVFVPSAIFKRCLEWYYLVCFIAFMVERQCLSVEIYYAGYLTKICGLKVLQKFHKISEDLYSNNGTSCITVWLNIMLNESWY